MNDPILFDIVYKFIVEHQALSYFIILLTMILESIVFVGIFIPAGLLTVVFGFIAYNGILTTAYILLVALIGAILGDIINYSIGSYNTKKHALKNIEKANKLLQKKDYLGHGEDFFKKHGGKSILFGRFVGVIRPFIGFIAGKSLMPFLRFVSFSIAGSILWILFYFGIGYLFSSSINIFLSWIKKAEDILLVIVIITIAYLYIRSVFNQKMKAKVIEKSNEILDKIQKLKEDDPKDLKK